MSSTSMQRVQGSLNPARKKEKEEKIFWWQGIFVWRRVTSAVSTGNNNTQHSWNGRNGEFGLIIADVRKEVVNIICQVENNKTRNTSRLQGRRCPNANP